MPTIVAQYISAFLPRSIEVEEHTAVVHIAEACLGCTIDGGDGDRLMLRHILRHVEADAVLADLQVLVRNGVVITHLDSQMTVVVIQEVVALDGYFLAWSCPLVAHTVDGRSWNDGLEIVCHGVLLAGDEVDFITYLVRDSLWHGYDDGVVRHVTGVQDCRLVVEVDFGHTSQVSTHNTDGIVERCGSKERVLAGSIHWSNIIDSRSSTCHFILVWLVLARSESCAGCNKCHGE